MDTITVTVTVTEEDVNTARDLIGCQNQERCKHCAIAMAIRREHPEFKLVSLGWSSGALHTDDGMYHLLSVSQEAREVMDAFDTDALIPLPQTLTFEAKRVP